MDQGLKLVLLPGNMAGLATRTMVLRTHVADAAALLEELLDHAQGNPEAACHRLPGAFARVIGRQNPFPQVQGEGLHFPSLPWQAPNGYSIIEYALTRSQAIYSMKNGNYVTSLVGLCSGMALLSAAPSASAQLRFAAFSPNGLPPILDGLTVENGSGTGTKVKPVAVRATVNGIGTGIGTGWLAFAGMTTVGPVASPIYRNSAWIKVTLKNDSGAAWQTFDLNVGIYHDKPSTPVDGISFGSLSTRTVSKFNPAFDSLDDLGKNPWNFSGDVNGRPIEVSGWDPADHTPGGVVQADRLKFSLALGDSVRVGEEISVQFLMSQNWTSDIGFMRVTVAVPEIPWTGVVSALALGAFAVIRRVRG